MNLIAIVILFVPIYLLTARGQEEPYYLEIPFEDEEAFEDGALGGQQGWEVLAGRADIVVPEASEPHEGQRHLQSTAGEDLQTHIRLEPYIDAEDELVTVTVELDMAPSGDSELVPVARIYGVELAYRVWDDGKVPTLYVLGEAGDWIEIFPEKGFFRVK